MKPTFIELTHSREKVLINLDNVVKITPRENSTSIVFNFAKGETVYTVTVDEEYSVVKKLIDSQK